MKNVGMDTRANSAQPNVSPYQAWTAVVMLCLFIAVSFVDRNIIALLVDPIRADLGISDKYIGLLFGLGFALFYICAGVPLAHLADRGNRKRLLLFGVVLWSLTTLAAGFAVDFTTLAIARAGVAIGEAVLTPIAISLIADLFSSDKRSLPTSINLMTGGLMASGSSIIGGAAYALAEHYSSTVGLAAWRLTFVIVAIPGLVLAALFALLVREPQRMDDQAENADAPTLGAAFQYFFAHFALYGMSFLGVSIFTIEAYGLVAWGPTLLSREHGLSHAQAGTAFGAAAFIGVAIGSLLIPLVLNRLRNLGPARAIVIAMTAFPAITVPVLALTINSDSLPVVLFGICVGMAGIVSGPIFAPLLIQAVAPARLRARMTAISLIFNTLISLGLGPLIVPMIAAHDGMDLGASLALIAAIVFLLGLASYSVPIRTLRARDRASSTDIGAAADRAASL